MSHNVYYEKENIMENSNSIINGTKHSIYAFKDADLGITEVFTINNDAIAVRQFTELCNKKDTYFNKYFEKVSLWKIAEFNEVTGQVTSIEPKCVIEGKQCYIPQTA